ncbi:MAG: O-antigen ligase family protein, partial [Patescibacteria group bacterium]
DSAKIAIQIIKDKPFLGVGFNTYRYTQIKYGFRNPLNSRASHADAGTDNSFLFIFATTGIVGLIFYSNLLWKVLKTSYRNYKKYEDKHVQRYIAITVIASMGGIIIDSLFINSLFYSFILIWLWLMLGLTENT